MSDQINFSNSNKSNNKEPLLYLCHRIPFPPNKGDKIRSFNILKKLSEHYDIHLGCFIDDAFDKQYVGTLAKYCASVFYLDQHKTIAKIKGLTGFLTNKAITLPYYFDKRMQQWSNRTLAEHKIRKVFVYSSSMAQYVQSKSGGLGDEYNSLERVIDFVDVDSDKWRQYAEKKSGIAKWFFNREYKLLAREENAICAQFTHSLFVSADEAKLFRDNQPQAQQTKVHGVLNGVDVKFFDPGADFSKESLVPDVPFISFTGAMDYWANIDAVLWFVEQVWPLILAKQPDAVFCIVGGNPSREVSALANNKGIVVTGRVHDVRPFIEQAQCVVAPLQIARGIQNKVLEAMSLNKAIVVTTMAMVGINAEQSTGVIITDDSNTYAQACLALLSEPPKALTNREWILAHFTWQQTLQPLMNYFSTKESH
ncbi:glycosyl transferase family 1 [Colwellia sp. MT41]|uniref:TIGR03087 family PEP-CTERM/XrtA system glycosyltransferase n=1 Tax=Colwellia sp. MT41 TaxID=58049 RepID=UPI000717A1F2|nr:TIGR03087 family PEP-CTERM/XrtA system glycosyltransferase [Colwellia sp. MT41]ALO36467.1 glycosyl transferase family 1 [Colwellia sp. MT41]